MIILVMRMGWVGVEWVGIIPDVPRATLHDLHLHLMLGYMIFIYILTDEDGVGLGWGGWGGGNTKRVSCYAAWSSFALDARLHDLHLHSDRWGWGGLGVFWGGDNTRRVSCYAAWSSLALDATLHDLHLHLMLRYMIFTCTWCYATWWKTK